MPKNSTQNIYNYELYKPSTILLGVYLDVEFDNDTDRETARFYNINITQQRIEDDGRRFFMCEIICGRKYIDDGEVIFQVNNDYALAMILNDMSDEDVEKVVTNYVCVNLWAAFSAHFAITSSQMRVSYPPLPTQAHSENVKFSIKRLVEE